MIVPSSMEYNLDLILSHGRLVTRNLKFGRRLSEFTVLESMDRISDMLLRRRFLSSSSQRSRASRTQNQSPDFHSVSDMIAVKISDSSPKESHSVGPTPLYLCWTCLSHSECASLIH